MRCQPNCPSAAAGAALGAAAAQGPWNGSQQGQPGAGAGRGVGAFIRPGTVQRSSGEGSKAEAGSLVGAMMLGLGALLPLGLRGASRDAYPRKHVCQVLGLGFSP